MYVKKLNFVIYLALALVVGFGTSFLIGSMDVESDQLSGDISKANRYNNVKEDPQLALLQEKLQNDQEYFNQTQAVMSFLQTRVGDLADLTEKTIAQCSDIEEFQDQLNGLKSLNAKACNTNLALTSVADGLSKMANGQKALDYEQASNNATAGFRKIEGQMGVGKSFVETATKYLEGKEDQKYAELASLVTKWTIYSYQDAKMNHSESNATYWNDQYGKMTDGTSKILLASFLSEVNQYFTIDNLNSEFTDALEGSQYNNTRYVDNLGIADMDQFALSSLANQMEMLNNNVDGYQLIENLVSGDDMINGFEFANGLMDPASNLNPASNLIQGIENMMNKPL